MARTIDNLGVDISTRYAEDQEFLDQKLLKEARLIPSQTNISVTLPSFTSEFDQLFDMGTKKLRWALFYPPSNYFISRRRLFADQLIPDLGSIEKQESQLERIEAIGDEEKKRRSPSEYTELENEQEIVLKLLKKLRLLNQYLIDINSRRGQYQKG